MKVVPDFVHGAWTRRWVVIDGGPRFETQHVVWVQSGTCYADLRVPFDAAAAERCFTGRSGWDVDGYRWAHHLDLERGVPADDVGQLEWDGDLLVERGRFPTEDGLVPYEEGWARLPGWDGTFLALEADTACLVRCGDHAITVEDRRWNGGSFAAAYRRLQHGAWVTVATIGDGERLSTPAQLPRRWRVVHRGDCS
jgi:hypothetical protein